MSDETPVRQGLCVFCGTARPVTKPICPQCGHPWIDTKVGEEPPALTPEIVAVSVEEREAAARARAEAEAAPRRSLRPWVVLVGAAVALIAIGAVYLGLRDGDGADAAAGTVAPTATTTSPPTSAATTTATTTSSVATTTTAAPTTTTSTTTTSTTTTTLAPIEAVGEPVPVADLTLGAFALGPFAFNADTSYLGRLVASLGQPDARRAAGVDLGLCPGDEGSAYTWGALTAIFRIENGIEVLVGYQLTDAGTDHPTQTITTRSGLALGHTIEKLAGIYTQSGLAIEDIDGEPHFILLRSNDDATLLWGPVSDTTQTGTVGGIYSPRVCDGGPRPAV